MNKYLFALLLILCSTQYISIERIKLLQGECHRLKQNQSFYIDSMSHYKTQNGRMAISINILQLRCHELESEISNQNDIINQLKIKLRRVEQLSTTVHQADLNIKTLIQRDTILHRDIDYHFYWQDSWNQLRGTIIGDSITCKLSTRDTLHQIIHRIPKKFLFIKYGTKYLRQEIITSNPNCHIVWSKLIKIVK